MAVLIVAGIATIAVTVAKRTMGGGEGDPQTFGSVSLGLPQGSRIEWVAATGERIVLRARLPDGGDRVLVVDPATGRTLGTIAP